MSTLRSFLLALTALSLAACAAPAAPISTLTPQPTAIPLPTVEPTAALVPTATPVPPTEEPTNAPEPTATATATNVPPTETPAATRVKPTMTPVPSPTGKATSTSGSGENGDRYAVGNAYKWLNEDRWSVGGLVEGPVTGNPVTVAFAQGCETNIWLNPAPGRVCGKRLFNILGVYDRGVPLPFEKIQPGVRIVVEATQAMLETQDGSGPFDVNVAILGGSGTPYP